MSSRKKDIDGVISEVGNLEETGGLVRNDAAKSVRHLLGDKAADLFGETLEDLKRNPQQYSMVFKDKGLRLKALAAVSEKARVTEFPTDADSVFAEFDTFMTYCDTFLIAPTLGLFAIWLGTNLDDFEAKRDHYLTTRPSAANALDICKELLRGFLETKALDGDIAPAVYLHQNKYMYQAVETAPSRVSKDKGEHIRDASQIAEVIQLLPDEN